MKLSRLAVAVTGCAGACLIFCSAPCQAETTETYTLPREIPVGPADENRETSEAVTWILTLSAETYAATDALKAKGSYVYVTKDEEGETSYITANLTMNFLRPDKMAVVCESEDASLDCAFFADGTTVTHVSAEDKAYVTLPQPEALDSYAEYHRAGELYEEYSGALAFSVTGPILISHDTMGWMFEDVSRFVYEGKEEVNGAECHRIRFIQEDPDVIVIAWINEATWLIDKASFIRSYDAAYNMVESFEEGETATMSIVTWDSQTIEPAEVSSSAFVPEIPESYEHTQDKPRPQKEEAKGLWESLVGLAADSSPEETTWSLTRTDGTIDLILEKFADVKVPVADFEAAPAAGETAHLIVGSEDGTVTFFAQDGSKTTSTRLNQDIGLFNVGISETSETLLIAADKRFYGVSAYNAQGAKLWSYHHPFTTIESVSVDELPSTGIYVGLSGDSGLRKLNSDGKVLWATNKVDYVQSTHNLPVDTNRVIARSLTEVFVLDTQLNLLQKYAPDEWVGPMKWDASTPASPYVCLAYSGDKDVLLQRRSETGEISRTTMIQPKAEDISGSGFTWVRLPIEGKVETCAVVLMSDGTLVILSKEGSTYFRGKIDANPALIKQNDDSVVISLVVADLDGNGVDEIYTRMHTNLMRIIPAK